MLAELSQYAYNLPKREFLMILRLILLTLVLSIGSDSLTARPKYRNQPSTQETLGSTFQEDRDEDLEGEAIIGQSWMNEKDNTRKSRSNSASSQKKKSPTVEGLIKTLENDAQRSQLVKQLRTLSGNSSASTPRLCTSIYKRKRIYKIYRISRATFCHKLA